LTAVIDVRDLKKTYRAPFSRRKVPALHGISFSVDEGEIFGFLGPNGAGKTTTIRILMGLIAPSGGRATLFGHDIPSRRARARLGFLPESPYFYDYLTVAELLDLAGRLFGMSAADRRARAEELIATVGLEHARRTPMKKYSKGMLQRAGIAQALMNDPDLVVLDEPMSGLDPVGRKEVRDIILSLRDRGKTVFFSSHILADVETICDRVAIVVRGEVHDVGRLSELVQDTSLGTDVVLRIDGVDESALEALEATCEAARRREGELVATLSPDVDTDELLARAREAGAKIISVAPRHETLEDLFIRRAAGGGAKVRAQEAR
jgi:ABC-2 type transport system ATP-binding protein